MAFLDIWTLLLTKIQQCDAAVVTNWLQQFVPSLHPPRAAQHRSTLSRWGEAAGGCEAQRVSLRIKSMGSEALERGVEVP